MKKRILALALSCISLFSLVACNQGTEGTSSGNENTQTGTTPDNVFEELNVELLKDGASDYVVVIPENADDKTLYASQELVYFFREATGLKLKVVTDTNKIFKKSSKYLSIGETTLFKQAGLKVEDWMYDDGVIVDTVEQSVFMCGGGSSGDVYAVYDFLAGQFGYEYYGRETYEIERNVTDMNVLDFDLCYNPSFRDRAAWGKATEGNSSTNLTRLRHKPYVNVDQSMFMRVGIDIVHNSIAYIDGAAEGHEEFWYGTNPANLCFTAHGDPDEYAALVDQVTKVVKNVIIQDSQGKYLLMSLSDCEAPCGCSACTELMQTYGSYSAVMLLLVNDVRPRIQEWFESEEGAPYARENFVFGILAYMGCEDAPVVWDEEKQTYVGMNGFKMAEGTGILYAPIYHDYTRSIYDEVNKTTLKNYLGWDALTDNLWMWGYDMNFQGYFEIYDTLSNMQEFARFCKDRDLQYYFLQGQQFQCKDNSAWGHLHTYLNSKIGWNTEIDVLKETKKFFKAFYGPAGDAMYEMYTQMTVHTAYLKETYSKYGGMFGCETSTLKKEFWPKQLLVQWIDEFQEIYKTIEFLKTDNPEMWQEYYDRIRSEEASPLFIILSMYQAELDTSTLNEYKQRFKTITGELDFIGNTGMQIEQQWSALGISY